MRRRICNVEASQGGEILYENNLKQNCLILGHQQLVTKTVVIYFQIIILRGMNNEPQHSHLQQFKLIPTNEKSAIMQLRRERLFVLLEI